MKSYEQENCHSIMQDPLWHFSGKGGSFAWQCSSPLHVICNRLNKVTILAKGSNLWFKLM